jgi:hypothetical protein
MLLFYATVLSKIQARLIQPQQPQQKPQQPSQLLLLLWFLLLWLTLGLGCLCLLLLWLLSRLLPCLLVYLLFFQGEHCK